MPTYRLTALAALLSAFVPLIPAAAANVENEPTAAEQEVARLRSEQQRLLEQVRRELSALPSSPESSNTLQVKRRAQLERLLTDIERRINEESRTSYVTANTNDPTIRSYYERLQRRIEERGNSDFPKGDDGTSVYGRVILTFALTSGGKIERIDIADSTSDVLAKHSIKLLRQLEPFERFPSEVAKRIDRMVITAPFNYTRE